MAIVTTKNLCKVYGQDDTAVHALRDINIEIEKGEFVALLGASGSGKSTLLHMLGGVDIPSSGSVYVDGTDVFNQNETQLSIFRRRQVGFVFQFFNLIPVLNVQENILLPLGLDNREADQQYFGDILSTFGLSGMQKRLPNQLSGGQQQRVAVARALIHRPALILADEPTGNLDTKNSREIISLMKSSVKRYGQTLVLITHDASIAAQADRVLIMEDGRISSQLEG